MTSPLRAPEDLPRSPEPVDRLGRRPFWLLLAGTALLYLWGLGAGGWSNAFYSAAAQAGSQSWSAFFFGASDAAGSITVDKPPLALWPMALSVKVFGLSGWSILLPQALAGLATLALVHDGVRRATGSRGAALLAGVAFALTPVAVLMFRFNNPDALLTLLLTGAAWATLRAVHSPVGRRWLVLAGALVGLAFLTKMMQGFLVLPALGLTYLLHAAVPWRRRVVDLLLAAAAMVVAGSWWVLAVELWPASARPYIGGSQHNSVLELVLGYNGFGRLTGDEVGAVHSGRGWGSNTVLRLLGPSSGSQVSWLLPAAVVLAVTAVVLVRRRAVEVDDQTPGLRPALTLWLGTAAITWLTFSLMAGIYHPYYTVALSPAVASLLGLGAHVVWRRREERGVRWVLGVVVVGTAVLALVLLWPALRWQPWLPGAVVLLSGVAVWRLVRTHRRAAPIGAGFATAALLAAFASPAAYSLATVASTQSGAVPKAGPDLRALRDTAESPPRVEPAVGGLMLTSTPSPSLVDLLERSEDDVTWVAAVVGSNSAAGFQLATGRPVMPVGGFNGTDPNPTLARFIQLVDDGRIGWFLGGGGLSSSQLAGSETPVLRSGSDDSRLIEAWVSLHFDDTTVGGVTVYDLTP